MRSPTTRLLVAAAASVVVALAFALLGLLGHWSAGGSPGTVVEAEVVTGAACTGGGPERVRLPTGGVSELDACGHQAGERVRVAVGDVVRLGDATAGATVDLRPVGVVLLIFAGVGGGWLAGFCFPPVRRRPT
ncbi:hypothetical protein V5P93_001061 [Actinokineospora auranticolor]|uniref:Uncharacterized protein n=1 Tax=Actinokineospora auranticolor TaxID=155976 RepID=A0A2S6GEC8_9PSEU|nr:hypothetical protein [Actinokineospora auranticolor]PPK63436.1 hypothetical protein CLV40_12849 [Actinokineospora auranticolor]